MNEPIVVEVQVSVLWRCSTERHKDKTHIDLMMLQAHDFLGAVSLLKNWLDQYRHDRGSNERPVTPDSPLDDATD